MLASGDSYTESYPAEAESVARARAAVTSFAVRAGARGERLETIRLAASEAITNAVKHAYPGQRGDAPRRGGVVEVSATIADGELQLVVADSGSGLGARGDEQGLGLGLTLIARLADDFQIHSRAGGGTEVRMRFRLQPAPGTPAVPLSRPVPPTATNGHIAPAAANGHAADVATNGHTADAATNRHTEDVATNGQVAPAPAPA
jgi:anti-sigma regulatory factor (Ser/Thr protein kinase)